MKEGNPYLHVSTHDCYNCDELHVHSALLLGLPSIHVFLRVCREGHGTVYYVNGVNVYSMYMYCLLKGLNILMTILSLLTQLQGEDGVHCQSNIPTCKKPCLLHNTLQVHLLPAAEDIWEETSSASIHCCLHLWVLCVWRKQQSQHAGTSDGF